MTATIEERIRAIAGAAVAPVRQNPTEWLGKPGAVLTGEVEGFGVHAFSGLSTPPAMDHAWSPEAMRVDVRDQGGKVWSVPLRGHLEWLIGPLSPPLGAGERVVLGALAPVGAREPAHARTATGPVAAEGGSPRFALGLPDRAEEAQPVDPIAPGAQLTRPPWLVYTSTAAAVQEQERNAERLEGEYSDREKVLRQQLADLQAARAELESARLEGKKRLEAARLELEASGYGHVLPGVASSAPATRRRRASEAA